MADLCDMVESTAVGESFIPSSSIIGADVYTSNGTLSDTAIQSLGILLTSSMVGSSSLTDIRSFLLVSRGVLASAVTQFGTLYDMATSKGVGLSSLWPIVTDQLDDYGIADAIVLPTSIGQLVLDTAHALSQVFPHTLATILATSGGTLASRVFSSTGILVTSTAVGHSSAYGRLDSGDLAIATAVLASSVTGVLNGYNLATDQAQAASAVSDHLDALQLAISEAFASAVVIGEPTGGGWTANTDTLAMSRYEHDPLNSLATIGDRLFLAGHDGVFQRAGTDDDGQPIDGYVQTGMQRWGANSLFRIQQLYVGYTGPRLRVQIGETSTGAETTWSYDMPTRTTAPTVPTHGRVTPGQGMRTMYARVTLRNIDGGALRITDAEMTTFQTSRKV